MSSAEIADVLRREGLEDEAKLTSNLNIQRYEQLALLAWDFPEAVEHVDVTQMTTIALGRSSTAFMAITGGGMNLPPLTHYSMGANSPSLAGTAASGRPSHGAVSNASAPSPLLSVRHDLPNWPVRNQGGRGTCVAHAVVALIEHEIFHSRPNAPIDASEQYMFWTAKAFDPSPTTDGTKIEYASIGLSKHGYVEEWAWPYIGTPNPMNVTHGPPPGNLTSISTQLTHSQRIPGSGNAALVYAALLKGPVAVSVPVYGYPNSPANNWINRAAQLYGIIQDPILRPRPMLPVSEHAVTLIGFSPDATEPHGGYFVFRNSWGPNWAALAPTPGGHVWRSGYGQVSATYIEKYVWEWGHI